MGSRQAASQGKASLEGAGWMHPVLAYQKGCCDQATLRAMRHWPDPTGSNRVSHPICQQRAQPQPLCCCCRARWWSPPQTFWHSAATEKHSCPAHIRPHAP